jgi:acyl-CoA thioesterase
MSASFHVPEPGVRHQQPPPKVPDPETLLSWTDVIKKSAEDPRVPPKLRNQMVKGANFYIPFAFDLRRPDEQQLTYPPKPRPAWQTSVRVT